MRIRFLIHVAALATLLLPAQADRFWMLARGASESARLAGSSSAFGGPIPNIPGAAASRSIPPNSGHPDSPHTVSRGGLENDSEAIFSGHAGFAFRSAWPFTGELADPCPQVFPWIDFAGKFSPPAESQSNPFSEGNPEDANAAGPDESESEYGETFAGYEAFESGVVGVGHRRPLVRTPEPSSPLLLTLALIALAVLPAAGLGRRG